MIIFESLLILLKYGAFYAAATAVAKNVMGINQKPPYLMLSLSQYLKNTDMNHQTWKNDL